MTVEEIKVVSLDKYGRLKNPVLCLESEGVVIKDFFPLCFKAYEGGE